MAVRASICKYSARVDACWCSIAFPEEGVEILHPDLLQRREPSIAIKPPLALLAPHQVKTQRGGAYQASLL